MSKMKHYFFKCPNVWCDPHENYEKKYVGHISCQNRIIRNFICFIKKMWSTFTRLSCLNVQFITLMWQISFLVCYWNCKAQLWSCIWIEFIPLGCRQIRWSLWKTAGVKCSLENVSVCLVSQNPEQACTVATMLLPPWVCLFPPAGNKHFTSTIMFRITRQTDYITGNHASSACPIHVNEHWVFNSCFHKPTLCFYHSICPIIQERDTKTD